MPGAEGPFLDHLCELSPRIRETAPESEQRGRLDDDLVDELKARRFFRLWIPASLDGEEMNLPGSLRVFEAGAHEDGALGWALMIGAGGGLFAPLLPLETARAIYGRPGALIAGSGNPTAVAEEVDGGYRVTGRWRYASGAHHATHFTASTRLQRGGEPLLDDEGNPRMLAMAFTPDQVSIIPAWDVVGMRATGSDDIAVEEVFVPADWSFDVFAPPRDPGPLYRYPFMTLTALSAAAVPLGIAARMLAEWEAYAAGKTPLFSDTPLSAQPFPAARYADALATFRSARAWWEEEARFSWDIVARGEALPRTAMRRPREARRGACRIRVPPGCGDPVRALRHDRHRQRLGARPLLARYPRGRTAHQRLTRRLR
ncbi:MAG: hypothetical protein U5Q44_02780 [Dehalococcoidia bacterium]|nr:hypothetical protein [Dehalococcoidia bacterium]